jgi:hypothetical protein
LAIKKMKGDRNAELDPIFQKDLDLEYDPRKSDRSEACLLRIWDDKKSSNVHSTDSTTTAAESIFCLVRTCFQESHLRIRYRMVTENFHAVTYPVTAAAAVTHAAAAAVSYAAGTAAVTYSGSNCSNVRGGDGCSDVQRQRRQ